MTKGRQQPVRDGCGSPSPLELLGLLHHYAAETIDVQNFRAIL